MTIRRRFLAGVLAVPLLLAGCSSEPDLTPEEQFVEQLSSELPPEPGTEADPTTTVAVGDTIPMTCYSHLPCDAELLITEITVGEECRYGTNDYGEFGENPNFGKPEDGQQYLQMWGEFSVDTAANGWTMVDDPQIIDAEGFTQTADMSVDCRNADDGHESWSATVDQGQKARLYGSWIIPTGTEAALLEDHRVELPEHTPVEVPADPQPPAAQEPVAPEPESQPTSIWTDPGEGYNCPQTDAWVIDASHCTPENLGSSPAPDLSTIPYSEGGTCPAYQCGYGTDAEGNDLNQERAESHSWWGECISANTADYCRANDPWQQ